EGIARLARRVGAGRAVLGAAGGRLRGVARRIAARRAIDRAGRRVLAVLARAVSTARRRWMDARTEALELPARTGDRAHAVGTRLADRTDLARALVARIGRATMIFVVGGI